MRLGYLERIVLLGLAEYKSYYDLDEKVRQARVCSSFRPNYHRKSDDSGDFIAPPICRLIKRGLVVFAGYDETDNRDPMYRLTDEGRRLAVTLKVKEELS